MEKWFKRKICVQKRRIGGRTTMDTLRWSAGGGVEVGMSL